MTERILWQVKARHMVAGLVTDDDRVVEAAPILRWAMGKTRGYLREYFSIKGWKISFVGRIHDHPSHP